MSSTKDWWRFHIEINKNMEDLIIWKLNQFKITTYSFNYLNKDDINIQLLVWLPSLNWVKSDRDNLEKELKKTLSDNGFTFNTFGWHLIKEEDWINSWKDFWDLELIGQKFLVLPCWMNLSSQYDKKVVIKIDPGAAFGTGGHPSTALCLEEMEKTVIKNAKVLDVGCGSGILSIAAKKLGGKYVHVIDNDYLAINSTRENLSLNFDELNSFEFNQGSFLEIKNKKILKNYDLILCNILASVIKPLIPHFHEVLNSHGFLILSGILDSQKEEIIKLLNLYHFKIDNVSSKKDWICIKSFKLTEE